MEAAKATRDGHESEVARLEEEILAHGAETEACRTRLKEAEAAPAAPPPDAGPSEAAQELTRAHIDARKAAKKQVKEQRARVDGLHGKLAPADVLDRAGKECEIPNFKGSYLGRFQLVLADFWTSDHLLERSRSVNTFSGTRARGTLTLKRR